jgi:hypothetical protein
MNSVKRILVTPCQDTERRRAEWVERRRHWELFEKERIVAASLEPGAIASHVNACSGQSELDELAAVCACTVFA